VTLAALVGLGAVVGLGELRRSLRPDYLEAMAAGRTWDPHPLQPSASDAWPIWLWLDARADREAWLARLSRAGVELVVLGVPWTVERDWVEQLPQRFTPLAVSAGRRVLAFRYAGSP
jgi:hypothetical protein